MATRRGYAVTASAAAVVALLASVPGWALAQNARERLRPAQATAVSAQASPTRPATVTTTATSTATATGSPTAAVTTTVAPTATVVAATASPTPTPPAAPDPTQAPRATVAPTEDVNAGNKPLSAPAAMACIDRTGFCETFDGNPASPQAWRPPDWDVTVHSRDTNTWQTLEPMAASHGADCAGPPNTHPTSSYEDAVFLCRDHVMTAIKAGGYGLIYLTPPAMADWSQGEAVVRWEMSTQRTSARDWVDVWLVPYEDDLQLALEPSLPDGNGFPRRALHVSMDNGNAGSIFRVTLYEDFAKVGEYQNFQMGLEYGFSQLGLSTSASRRDVFELRLRQGHVWFGMPQYGMVFADADVPGLTWTRGVVTLGHHSYNPEKDCGPGAVCTANTWHFDNVSISPAAPLTIVRPDRRLVDAAHPGAFVLASPAPQGATLRFAGIGDALEVSYDGGPWRPAQRQAQSKPAQGEIFGSYRTAIPAGTRRVDVRGQAWWGGGWAIRDLSVWAPGAPGGTPSTPAPSTPTNTATPAAVATTTPTAIPPSSTTVPPTVTATLTPLSSASTPTATAVSTSTGTPSPTPTPVPPAAVPVPCSLDKNVLTCVLST